MPKINKPKKIKNLPVVVKTANSKKKIKKTKPSPVDYYNCLLTSAQQGWYDPKSGTKKKITACCKDCKLNAPSLAVKRQQEVRKLITSYRQVGECLTKLLQPIK
jgi:hypothetical protein